MVENPGNGVCCHRASDQVERGTKSVVETCVLGSVSNFTSAAPSEMSCEVPTPSRNRHPKGLGQS